jgi:hypothetical protein
MSFSGAGNNRLDNSSVRSTSHVQRSDFTASFHCLGRDHEHDCARDEPAEPILPRLAGLDVVAVDERGETGEFKAQ